MFAKKLLALTSVVLFAGVAVGADKPVETAPPPRPVPAVKTFAFEMRDTPWDDVLGWYADTTGLTPIYTISPKGKFTFTPPKDKKFTIGEITDILNDGMAKQKLLLLRRQVSFTIIRTDEKIDYSLVTRLTLEELPERGRTEMVHVIRPLRNLHVEETAPEVRKLLTPLGAISQTKHGLFLVDTVGNLRRIMTIIEAMESLAIDEPEILNHRLIYTKAEVAKEKLQTLLPDSATGLRAPPTPRTVAVFADAGTNTVTVIGSAEKIGLAKKLIAEWDRLIRPGVTLNDPELRKYSLPPGTAADLAKALQTLAPSLRVLAVPATNELFVLGTPRQHAALAILFKLLAPNKGEKWTVIPLERTNPEDMAERLKTLFPSSDLKIEVLMEKHALRVYASEATTRQVVAAIQTIEGIGAAPERSTPWFKPGSELRRYKVPPGTAEAVAKTLKESCPKLRLFAVPERDEIWILATPEEHFEAATLLKS